MRAIDNMDNLVITFDMSESELAQYLEDHQDNEAILEELMSETSRFDQLKTMELQFTDRDDPTQLMSVILEKRAIRDRIKEMFSKYKSNDLSINATAEKYALDTRRIAQSELDFDAIVKEIGADQDRAETVVQHLRPEDVREFLSIFVEPAEVTYGDILRVWGVSRVAGSANRSVTVNLDGVQSGAAAVETDGRYEFRYPIERIGTGTHRVYVRDRSRQSDVVNFSVKEVPSMISLGNDDPKPGKVTVYGDLYTGGERAVTGATVGIVSDGAQIGTAVTDKDGVYETVLVLPRGRHTLKARFTGEGFPIGPSESEEIVIDVPYGGGDGTGAQDPLSLLLAGGIMIASGAGAAFYLRRRRSLPGESPPILPGALEEILVLPGSEAVPDRPGSLLDLFARLLGLAGLREAAFAVYRELGRRVTVVLGRVRVRSLTPRELAARTSGQPFHAALLAFIPHYEGIRYGPEPESERGVFESAIEPLDLATRERENE
jgi:hypothetical protein